MLSRFVHVTARSMRSICFFTLRCGSLLRLPLCISRLTARVRIASWNVKLLGWNNGKNLNAAANIVGRIELVALQDVMGPAAGRHLAKIVSQDTGEPWAPRHQHGKRQSTRSTRPCRPGYSDADRHASAVPIASWSGESLWLELRLCGRYSA